MANKFQEKQILAEVLNELYNIVEEKENSVHYQYKIVGKKDTQCTNWRTGELVWEDEAHTIPKMEDDWQSVPKTEDEMTEEDNIRIKVYQHIKTQLEKLI